MQKPDIERVQRFLRDYIDTDIHELRLLVRDRCLSGGHATPEGFQSFPRRELLMWLFEYDHTER